ncbi:hypothetical protein BpHYR1_035609, partial [Brachionus plicatilis]
FKNTHSHLSKSLVPFIRRVFLIKRLCSIPASQYCDKPLTVYDRETIRSELSFSTRIIMISFEILEQKLKISITNKNIYSLKYQLIDFIYIEAIFGF